MPAQVRASHPSRARGANKASPFPGGAVLQDWVRIGNGVAVAYANAFAFECHLKSVAVIKLAVFWSGWNRGVVLQNIAAQTGAARVAKTRAMNVFGWRLKADQI